VVSYQCCHCGLWRIRRTGHPPLRVSTRR